MRHMRSAISRVLEISARLFPKKAHVVLHGFPADEGNIVETVAALNSRYVGKIYWLVDEANTWVVDSAFEKVKIVPKYSPEGVYRYLTAEVVFFTHGLFGDTRPGRRQTFVNLWHGDGFKVKKDAEASKKSLYPAHYTVGCTTLLTQRRARDFRMPESSVLPLGNPRMDQFYRPISEEARRILGLPAHSKFIVWVPTFRANHGAGATKGWRDVSAGAPNPNDLMGAVALELGRAGYSVIVKPHPQDRESRSVPGTIAIDNSQLLAAGVSFYSLLGSAAGLITDYSSVWTEYLALDRPIGFVVPDREEYLKTRGLYPSDLFEWLPGPMLEEVSSVQNFVRELIEDDKARGSDLRAHAVKILGLRHGNGCTADFLLDALDRRNVFDRSGGLIDGGGGKGDTNMVIRRVRQDPAEPRALG